MARWIVLCCHSASSPPEKARCFDRHEDAQEWAGEYWTQHDLCYDRRLRQPFWVDASSGYDTDVQATFKGKKVVRVSHAGGDGPTISIMPESE